MANMIDYIDWRGDLSLEKDPFNEVDNLILAELAYVPFDNYVPGNEEEGSVTLADVGKRFFEDHPDKEELDKWNKSPRVLKKAMKATRFKNMRLRWFLNEMDNEREQQLAVVTFELEDGTSYVAFRGTDGTLVGWKEDFNMAYMFDTLGQLHAAAYMDDHFMTSERPLRLGGHSKGGNFAMFAGMFCSQEVREEIQWIYSNDGPGFHDKVMEMEGYKESVSKIISIIPESSVVGMLLGNKNENIVVKSDADGFGQHDPLSWQVKRKTFVKAAELAESSVLLDKTLTKWLATLKMEERQIFVDSLYDAIAASGAATIEEMNANPVKCYSAIIKAATKLPKEESKVIKEAFGKLAKTGSDVIKDNVQTKIDQFVDENFKSVKKSDDAKKAPAKKKSSSGAKKKPASGTKKPAQEKKPAPPKDPEPTVV